MPELKKKTCEIIAILSGLYPAPVTALEFSNPLEILIATILSAQCTDVRVNIVTKDLFKKYRSVCDYAEAGQEDLEQDIRSTGFYKNKAKNIRACCKEIMDKYGGEVPRAMDELTALPGVGRKTANCVLGNAFAVPGIVVDTHVIRLSSLIGLVDTKDPVKIEFALMDIVPKNDWIRFTHLLIYHGRNVCAARRPACFRCAIARLCEHEPKTKEKIQ